MNPEKSKPIFDELFGGKYINMEEINEDNIFVENPLYREIEINEDDYKRYYAFIGYTLNKSKFSYYLCEESEEMNKTQFKTYVLMLALLSWVSKNGISIDTLKNPKGGISKEQLSQVLLDEEYANWLMLSELAKASDPFNNYMILRNILLKNNFGNFVLSNHAKWTVESIAQLGAEQADFPIQQDDTYDEDNA